MSIRKGYDLHIHSNKSDGKETPKRIVEIAYKENLRGISLTDHNSIDGIEEAINAASECNKFKVIPGVEMSACLYNKKYQINLDIHLLFYFFDYCSNSIHDLFMTIKSEKVNYAIKIIERLKKENILSDKEVKEHFDKKIEQKTIKKEDIINYLHKEKSIDVGDCHARINRFDIGQYRPIIEESLEIFNVPFVLAHPGLIIDEYNTENVTDLMNYSILEELFTPYKKDMAGLETTYPYHRQGRMIPEVREKKGEDSVRAKQRDFSSSRYYNEKTRSLARKLDLLYIAGSDAHQKPNRSEIGECTTSQKTVTKLKRRVKNYIRSF